MFSRFLSVSIGIKIDLSIRKLIISNLFLISVGEMYNQTPTPRTAAAARPAAPRSRAPGRAPGRGRPLARPLQLARLAQRLRARAPARRPRPTARTAAAARPARPAAPRSSSRAPAAADRYLAEGGLTPFLINISLIAVSVIASRQVSTFATGIASFGSPSAPSGLTSA